MESKFPILKNSLVHFCGTVCLLLHFYLLSWPLPLHHNTPAASPPYPPLYQAEPTQHPLPRIHIQGLTYLFLLKNILMCSARQWWDLCFFSSANQFLPGTRTRAKIFPLWYELYYPSFTKTNYFSQTGKWIGTKYFFRNSICRWPKLYTYDNSSFTN